MAKQTFIICLEDENGVSVNFERWPYKKAETCLDHMVELYCRYEVLYGHDLDKASRVVCYPTPDGCTKGKPAWDISADEMRELMEKKRRELYDGDQED